MAFFGKRFEELADEFLSRQAMFTSDHRTTPSNVRILLRYFNGWALREIRPKDVEDMIAARLNEGVSKATANRQRACLSKMLNSAILWNYMPGPNPVARVKKFRESKGRVRWLTREEFDRLYDAASCHLKVIIVVAVMTGGRLTEILGLRWSDIDFDSSVLYFRKENTKGEKERQIPISPELLETLNGLRTPGNTCGRIFLWRNRPMKTVKTAFVRAREDAGLADVRFHDLRHTFASWYMQNGGDLYRLKELMGHSTITLTERYSHLSPDYIQSAVKYFGPPSERKDAGHADRRDAAPINRFRGNVDSVS